MFGNQRIKVNGWVFALVATTAGLSWGQIIGGGGSNTPSQPRQSTGSTSRPSGASGPVSTAAADALFAAGRFDEAARAYMDALRRSGNSPDIQLFIKLGDAQNSMVGDDFVNAGKARATWEAAAKKFPKELAPRLRLIKFYKDYSDISAGQTRLELVRSSGEIANEILAIEPDNTEAMFAQQRAVIEPYLMDQSNDTTAVGMAIESLAALQPKRPEELEIPFLIASAQAKMGLNAIRFGDKNEATKQIAGALDTMDKAIEKNPKSAGLLFRKAQLVQGLGPIAMDPNFSPDASTKPEFVDKVGEQVVDLLVKSVGLVGPGDKELKQIVSFAASAQERVGNTSLAESILRAGLAAQPEESSLRTQLAELLRDRPERLEDAAAVLAPATKPPATKEGVAGLTAMETFRRAQLLAVDIRLDQYEQLRKLADAGDPNAKAAADKLIPVVQSEMAPLQPKGPADVSPRYLRLVCRMQMANGDLAGALQTINRAIPRARESDPRVYASLLTLQGLCVLRQNKPDEAQALFEEALTKYDLLQARIEMTRMLIQRKAFARARPQIDYLRRLASDDPNVLQFQADLIKWDGNSDPALMKEMLERLPETNTTQQYMKIGVASRLGMLDVANRILDQLYAQFPNDAMSVLLRADVYERANEIPKAIIALEEFATKQPNNQQIKKAIARLKRKLGTS